MLYRMKLGAIVTTIPTIGFNVETIQVGDLTITSWDMGGRVRLLFEPYSSTLNLTIPSYRTRCARCGDSTLRTSRR